MKALFTLLVFTLLYPIQAQALDLKPLTSKKMTLAGKVPTVAFSNFRVLPGQGRTDWMVKLNNTSKANMARNTYLVQAFQVNLGGMKSPAGNLVQLTRDIRPGASINLQRPFHPDRDMNRIVFEVVRSRDKMVIKTQTFGVSLASSGPGAAASAGAPALPAGANTASSATYAPNDLQLTLHESFTNHDQRIRLTVKNTGSAVVNLKNYLFSITENVLMHADTVWQVNSLTQKLQPGQSATGESKNPVLAHCANFTGYTATATARSGSQKFVTRLDIDSSKLSLDKITLGFRGYNIPDKADEYAVLTVELDVNNGGTRAITHASLEGTLMIHAGNLNNFNEYMIPVSRRINTLILPGKSKHTITIPIGNAEFGGSVLYPSDLLWGKRIGIIKLNARLANALECGVPAYYSRYMYDQIDTRIP
ncbi:MAG: hypothetical protein HUK40_17335 [Desulfobacter sp.]|nr:hypothetical protein [Desulfobacter sp.]